MKVKIKIGDFEILNDEDEIEFIRKSINSYRSKIEKLQILVLGPGENNPDIYAKKCYKKRVEIRQSLRSDHTVIFPEEAFDEAKRSGFEFKPYISFEKHLIELSDCAIIISCPNCPGVEHEISTFAADPECVSKIFLVHANDRKYDSSWVLEDWLTQIKAGGGRIDNFDEADLNECKVRKKIEDEIKYFATFCGLYPYKKYGGVDNGN